MADATSKYTVFFTAQGSSAGIIGQNGNVPTGWTETYYSADGLSQSSLKNFVDKYVQVRADLLGIGAAILYCRQTSVANPAQKRLSQVVFMSGKQGVPSVFVSDTKDGYLPSCNDILIRVQDSLGHRRQLWFGGLPRSQSDQLLQQGLLGAYVSSPGFKQWQNAILGLQLGIRYGVTGVAPGVGTFGAIAQIIPEMVRRRDRGRPFYLERGRKLA